MIRSICLPISSGPIFCAAGLLTIITPTAAPPFDPTGVPNIAAKLDIFNFVQSDECLIVKP
jgi:hypothetical protein